MSRPVSDEEARVFINTIAPYAQLAYKKLGKVLPSICIGMSCVESGFGTAGSCTHHSYLGHKTGTGRTATKYWNKTFFISKTQEEYKIGEHTVINGAFRSYDSMEQCVMNFYELLNSNLYKKVSAKADYTTQMQQIKAVGYMTSSTEVNSVLKIINKYNLCQFDTISQDDKYFPKCMYTRNSIIEGLKSIKVNNTFIYRNAIAQANGINPYTGTPEQNTLMLNLLKKGKLLKP